MDNASKQHVQMARGGRGALNPCLGNGYGRAERPPDQLPPFGWLLASKVTRKAFNAVKKNNKKKTHLKLKNPEPGSKAAGAGLKTLF